MALANFVNPLLQVGSTPPAPTETKPPQRPTRASSTYLLRPEAEWGWRELSDYVEAKMRVYDAVEGFKRKSIYTGFLRRHGARAVSIAKFVMEDCGGVWAGKSVTHSMFCANADSWFADSISERLA